MPAVKNCHAARYFAPVVLVVAISLALAQEVLAQQLTVTAISPAHGATNVPANAIVSITFSAALDTSFRFADINLPIHVELHPDTAIVTPFAISYSADLRTIRLQNLNLQTNTRYVLLVTGARSTSGALLARPATATFSTGPTLPSGAVSGTVSYSGGVSGAVVGVFSALDEGATVGFAIADNNGSYTVPFLPGGNYFALSIKDVNFDGDLNPGSVDPIGGYDPDANKLVNAFTLAAGGNLTGINITLRNGTPKTARELFSPAIENIAKAVQSDAQLVALAAGNLSVDGRATFWTYLFYSPTIGKNFGLSGNDVICFPALNVDESDTLAVPLPPDWIDSKVALDSAQVNLGKDFLQKYPDAEIAGFAGPFETGPDAGSATRFASCFGGRQTFHLAKPQSILRKAGAQPQQVWLINYSDQASARSAFIALDVRTGMPLFVFRLTTAFPNLSVAQAAASLWAQDARLVLVGAPPGAGFSPVDGAALAWVFIYYSAGKDSLRQFIVFFGNLSGQENVAAGPKRPIPPGWLDSDKTGPVAESLGGAGFRQTHTNVEVEAFLGYINPFRPNRLLWGFRYASAGPQPDSLIIYVDALTGVRVDDKPPTPSDFTLRPAYPNPLRSGQVAQWALHTPSAVEARAYIYNVLGQRVAQILTGNLPAGEAVLQWNGRLANGLPAASGAYFLRFEYRVASGGWQVMTQPVLLRK